MKCWITRSRRPVMQHGRFITVEMHEVELPDGRIIPDWPWVVTPDFVTIFVRTHEGRYLCFRQTKYSVKGVSLAPVGGYMDPGEDPLTAAKRELMEESGYTSDQWIPMGSFAVDANRGAGVAHLFAALDARQTGCRTGGDLEEQEMLLLTREELEKAVSSGEFKVLPWVTTMSLGLQMESSGRHPCLP